MQLRSIKKGFIPEEYILEGSVTKILIHKDPYTEVAVLELTPGTKIAPHTHIEKEIFTNLHTGECVEFAPNELHGLENNSAFAQRWISKKTTR